MARNLIWVKLKPRKNMSWNTTAETIQLRCLAKRQGMESNIENLLMNLFIYNNELCINSFSEWLNYAMEGMDETPAAMQTAETNSLFKVHRWRKMQW